MNDNIKLFKSYYADLLIPNGFIFRDGKFVRVIPSVGAIFVYFRSRKTIYDVLVSIVSFAQNPVSIGELIHHNEITIWTLRKKHIGINFKYNSIYEFLANSLFVFKYSVYNDIIKICDSKDILSLYRSILNEFHIDDTVWYYDVRVASAMQSKEYEYILQINDAKYKHLEDILNKNQEYYDDFCSDLSRRNESIEHMMKSIKMISDIIQNGDEYHMIHLLNERIGYWDDVFKKMYSSFYKAHSL